MTAASLVPRIQIGLVEDQRIPPLMTAVMTAASLVPKTHRDSDLEEDEEFTTVPPIAPVTVKTMTIPQTHQTLKTLERINPRSHEASLTHHALYSAKSLRKKS